MSEFVLVRLLMISHFLLVSCSIFLFAAFVGSFWEENERIKEFEAVRAKINAHSFYEDTPLANLAPGEMVLRACDGLTLEEGQAMDSLVRAREIFVRLEKMHPSDDQDFDWGIHQCQRILMSRIVRRNYPQGYFNDAQKKLNEGEQGS
jgi:hypothetical protein